MKRFVNQWEFKCRLAPNQKGQFKEGCPCLIIKSNRNSYSPTTICVPITHKQNKSNIPPHYMLCKSDYPFFNYDVNILLCEQIVTIDIHTQVFNYMGKIDDKDKLPILNAIKSNFILK